MSRLRNKAASCDLDGERGARVSVIIPVAANEKLRVRVFKTMGEWLARRLQLTDANTIQLKGKSRVVLPMEPTTAPNSKDIKRTSQKTYVKLHSHKPEGRTHKSQTHTKQATRSCKTMLSNAGQSRAR